jgi:prepilin-type N-terminal cleavage/methylation domain-containing protein
MKQATGNIKQKGFSIIELVVVLVVFLIFLSAMVSMFISIVQQQNRVLTEQELYNQLSYTIEYMARAIRTAKLDTTGSCITANYNYALTAPVGNYYEGIKFLTNDGVCENFFVGPGTGNPGVILEETKKGGSPIWLLSNKFTIMSVRFMINGDTAPGNIQSILNAQYSSSTPQPQPRITILLDVKINTPGNVQEKIIQTTVSQRNLNFGP